MSLVSYFCFVNTQLYSIFRGPWPRMNNKNAMKLRDYFSSAVILLRIIRIIKSEKTEKRFVALKFWSRRREDTFYAVVSRSACPLCLFKANIFWVISRRRIINYSRDFAWKQWRVVAKTMMTMSGNKASFHTPINTWRRRGRRRRRRRRRASWRLKTKE